MHKRMISGLVKIFFVLAFFLFAAGVSYSEETKDEAPPYTRAEALKTAINPHEQINDEGEILWQKCLICHRNVPDPEKEKTIKDVKLRYAEDLKMLCLRCHTVIKHPAGAGVSAALVAKIPNHLIVPPKLIYQNLRLAQKEVTVVMPLEPETGKIFCATCHNPHERGVLFGKADWGADYVQRLRTYGLDICQNCHRK